jgi:AbrB family looped-hinge helix DNA binding protein
MADEVLEGTVMYGQNVRTNKDYRGVVRSIERDGRLSIPSEFWNRAGIQKLDKVEVLLTVQNEIIIFAAGYGRRDYIGIERIVGNNKQISIPAEYRRVLGLKANVEVEIFLTAQKEIIVKPYNKTSVQNVRTK